MKAFTILFFLIFTNQLIYSQNYQISFAGRGAATSVDSVLVENLTQCTNLKLSGNDILHLTGTSGINETKTDLDHRMQIFPNPSNGNFTVGFNVTSGGNTIIELTDITGKIILQSHELLVEGYHTYSLSGINRGIYTLKAWSDQFLYTTKIISSNASPGMAEIIHTATILVINNQNAASFKVNKMMLKSGLSLINMQYTTGDLLKLTGKSGKNRSILILIPAQTQTDTFNFIACVDADGNNYSILQAGTQTWMAENLKTTKYRNGDTIPVIADNISWGMSKSGAYCYYNNTSSNVSLYGILYNFYAVADTRKVCPTGWYVPSDSEWTKFTDYLGGTTVAGGKLKENCNTLWQSPNSGATNEKGFTALPGGFRHYDGTFYNLGYWGFWWSSTPTTSPGSAWLRGISNSAGNLYIYNYASKNGYSIRCIKGD